MIKTLDQLEKKVLGAGRRYKIAVAWGQDNNTLSALARAVKNGIAEGLLIGDPEAIKQVCKSENIDPNLFGIINAPDELSASARAVAMAKSGEADIVMKGLVGTDKFLKEIMHKEKGIMIPGAVLTYVCAIQLPKYHKLLFVTDTAVIPFPDLDQKVAMAGYAVEMARSFGIDRPKVALISATEKMNRVFQNTVDYAIMCKMAERGQISNCNMDGPLDIFLACDVESARIKGVHNSINGDADILLFPSLESSNPFYKGLMLFANGELAGLLRGTIKPVIVMSRSESEISKYYCIALACLMSSTES